MSQLGLILDDRLAQLVIRLTAFNTLAKRGRSAPAPVPFNRGLSPSIVVVLRDDPGHSPLVFRIDGKPDSKQFRKMDFAGFNEIWMEWHVAGPLTGGSGITASQSTMRFRSVSAHAPAAADWVCGRYLPEDWSDCG